MFQIFLLKNDTLRKKLLLLSKSQQTLLNTFNQSTMSQLKDVIEIYNNPLLLAQFLNAKKDQDQLENVNASRVTKSNSSGSISSILLSPLLEFQQETIQKLQNEIDSYKSSYGKLLIQHNEMGIKLEQLNKKLELEVKSYIVNYILINYYSLISGNYFNKQGNKIK